MIRILQGHCLDRLREMDAESVQCCVTSPPYWGLRDYKTAPVAWPEVTYRPMAVYPYNVTIPASVSSLGLEPTITEFIAHLVLVFREVRRALKDDGVLWVNMGDAYHTGAGKAKCPGGGSQGENWSGMATQPNRMQQFGLKPKDLIGQPWLLALALQADGWYLRQEIIWHKPNPMPESVQDRCTKAHEQIFLLSKSKRYYWDAAVMQEPAGATNGHDATGGFIADQVPGAPPQSGTRKSGNKARKPASERGVPVNDGGMASGAVAGSVPWEGFTRNMRDVWTIATTPFKEAHFATFPREIPRRCIRASTRPGDTVLDSFCGSGTTGLVADELQRDAVLIELSGDYADMARRRITAPAPLLAEVV